VDHVVTRPLLRIAQHAVGVVQQTELGFVPGLCVVGMAPLREEPEHAMDGFGLSVRTDLKNFVVIGSLVRRHTALPILFGLLSRLSAAVFNPASQRGYPSC